MLHTAGGIACTNEEELSSYPVLLAKIPGGQNNFVAVVNRGHYIWKHLLDTRRIWSQYRMMILELPWLEEQTHHLYYLRVMEVLLSDFRLVHAACWKDMYRLVTFACCDSEVFGARAQNPTCRAAIVGKRALLSTS